MNPFDNIQRSLMDWIKEIISKTVQELLAREKAKDGKQLMTLKETSILLGIDEGTFNTHYRYLKGFPQEQPGKKWSKLAVLKWLENQPLNQ